MIWFVSVLVLFVVLAYLTNPFSRITLVKMPFVVQDDGTLLKLTGKQRLHINQLRIVKLYAYLLCGFYILHTRYIHAPKSKSTEVEGIIRDIHRLRFNPRKLLLTSGDHFSSLFVRNLGVFYYPTLDARIPSRGSEWANRQIAYLQTLSYALGAFAKQSTLTTTIVPTGRYTATCINFYAYPSDTLYGMLYALASLRGLETARAFDYDGATGQTLETIPAAAALQDTYASSLAYHYHEYRRTVYDEETGLIRRDLHLSGAKDITRRESAFYDNVVFWKTTELAGRLGFIPHEEEFLGQLKQRIVEMFWYEKCGYFLEDLSSEGLAQRYYSSDWLIVLATGFLDPSDKKEHAYFTRSISYIQAHGIDQPFAIKYQHDTRAHRQFFVVKLAVASYGGDSIWSFWGMEYIKTLLALYRITGERRYLEAADYHIAKYADAMCRDRGYPELYDAGGNMLQTPLYRSIRMTGWVIGYEQVLAMRAAIAE